MLVPVTAVLNRDQLETVQGVLSRVVFVAGKWSAGSAARRVKHNEEADRGSVQIGELDQIVMGKLVAHPTYRAAALPLRIAVPYYARYTAGMAYGPHLDDPIMGTSGALYRADIAITIFLNEPTEYDGGELIIQTEFGPQMVKLAAGDAVLYSASTLHHVNAVTRGQRLVAVTWVQSLIRDPARRALLYDLHHAREVLLARDPDAPETVRVGTAYVNLVRMWSEL